MAISKVTTDKAVEFLKSFIAEKFVFGLDDVTIVTHYGAYVCKEEESGSDLEPFKHHWTTLPNWKGDKPTDHEIALVIHDSYCNIIGGDEDYRDNDSKWGEFNNAKNGYFAEPWNSWKMSITEDH